MQTTKAVVAETGVQTNAPEPLNMRKRIGSTTFIISVATSPSATERAEKKILRLIESEVSRIA